MDPAYCVKHLSKESRRFVKFPDTLASGAKTQITRSPYSPGQQGQPRSRPQRLTPRADVPARCMTTIALTHGLLASILVLVARRQPAARRHRPRAIPGATAGRPRRRRYRASTRRHAGRNRVLCPPERSCWRTGRDNPDRSPGVHRGSRNAGIIITDRISTPSISTASTPAPPWAQETIAIPARRDDGARLD